MSHENQRYFFGAPTRDQGKRVAWNDLKLLADPIITAKSETELWVRTLTGSEIWIVGFDRPERFEGSLWHGGALDEYADMKPEVWKENVYPALLDTGGWCWLIGVPAGRNHYYELSLYARSGENPDWGDYSWLSADVLNPAEVEALKSQYDERTFRQEFEGSFESYEGRAYVYYDSEVHRRPCNPVDIGPVLVCCDFNLDPCVWLVAQGDKDGTVRFLDEIVQRQTDIWKMSAELKERLIRLSGGDAVRARSRRVVFYGDLEHGKQRTVAATVGSWEILRGADLFGAWNTEFRLKPHPRIVDRVNAVNAKLRAADGKVRLYVDPKCRFLHKDFEMVDMEMLTKTADVGDRTHASDAAGYFIEYEWPVVPKTKMRTE